jgi:transcriptional regulator with XRE-family HTH domain
LTTSQLARRLGIKTETLHDWETDRSEPRSNRLLTLAGVLNVSPTWLLTGAGEAPIDALTSSCKSVWTPTRATAIESLELTFAFKPASRRSAHHCRRWRARYYCHRGGSR